ncbi:MAG: GNAT family N-acetyltransferase [Oscillospiraceae bacterium]|nr:GNAT family N-acetyltransferase [Oscillospiraceae bacterium]
MNITNSPAQTVDVDLVYTFYKELVEQYETDPVPMEKVLAWGRRKIESQLADYRVILADGEKAGYFHLSEEPDGRWELDDLYLFPVFRGKGIGSTLLRQITQKADEDQKTLFLCVFRKNEGAVRFYERNGFVITDQAGNSRWIMERKAK